MRILFIEIPWQIIRFVIFVRLFKKAIRRVAVLLYRAVRKIYFGVIPRVVRLIVDKVDPNLILLDSPYYKDNVKVLAEYILEHKPHYTVVCFIDKKQSPEANKSIKFIRRAYTAGEKNAYSISAYYYALKAKHIFYTHSFKWVGKRNNGQVIINLWHGSGYKGGGANDSSHIFDYMMVPGDIFVQSKAEFFSCEKSKILTLGYPRYDLFKEKKHASSEEFLKKFNIDLKDSKLVIWLPTFIPVEYLPVYENPASYHYSGLPLLENLDQALELDSFCEEQQIKLLVKKHNLRYFETPLDNHLEDLKNLIILSDESFKQFQIELYDLLPITSGLISDFSSVAVDYLLLDKPIAYVLKDLEDYRKTRGFVFDNPLEYMPGHHIYHINDLKNFILDVTQGNDKYQKIRKEKMPFMHNQTENYSQRIIDHFNL